MLEPTPFLQFVAPRLSRAQERLAEVVWHVGNATLPTMRTTPTHEHRPVHEVSDSEFEPVELSRLPIAWGRKFQQCWWKLSLPAGTGDRRYLRWCDQAEATVYTREAGSAWVPWYGIDPGHQFAPLPEKAEELLIESTCCRTGVWVTGEPQGVSDRGSIFEGGYLARRDDEAWHAWHDLDMLISICKLLYAQALPRPYGPVAGNDDLSSGGGFFSGGGYRTPLEVAPPLLRRLLHRLNDAADALDREGPAALRKVTAAIFKEFPAEPWAMKAILTGHAHIDLVWKWPERVGDFKAVHSFATVDRLMEAYPELHFGYSQPASYEAVQRRSPELMQRVGQRIKQGKWEPTGAMYVESDTQLPAGEALVRAVGLGQAGFRELTGSDSRVLWLPDVFGYSAPIPQILVGFGVPYFFTTKLHWSGATKFPYSGFRWLGQDGSEVVGFIAWEHYNLAATPRELKWAVDNQRQGGLFNETLVATGYGDGGGGPSEAMCERARRMKDLATMPHVEWGRIDGFFDRLAKLGKQLPSWRGEMYLEFHRGVQTTHGNLKSAYRAAERGLQMHEAVRCVTGGGPVDEHPWKRLCFAQFHDYLPGSSLQEVYDEGVPELNGIARAEASAARHELEGDQADGASCVFNPLPTPRIELLNGRPVHLPPLAGVTADTLEVVEASPVHRRGNVMDNGRVRLELREDGRIGSIEVDGHPLALREPACGLIWFPDFPAVYDAWDVERPTLSLGELVQTPVEATFEGDETRQVASFTRRVGRKSSATMRYILEAASPLVHVEMEIDWQDTQALLKIMFPTDYTTGDVRYGAPFGSVLRPQVSNTIGDDARFENPASRWVCVADPTEAEGLMLITEDKYGVGCREGLLHLSLVRSAAVTDAHDNPGLRDYEAYGGPGTPWQPFSDIGKHTVRFAFGRYRADAPRHEQPAALADTLYTSLVPYAGQPVDAGLLGLDGGEPLIPAWAQPLDGGWVLRLHETLGRRGQVQLRLADGWKASLVGLRGQPVGDLPDNVVRFTPYQLLSVKLSR